LRKKLNIISCVKCHRILCTAYGDDFDSYFHVDKDDGYETHIVNHGRRMRCQYPDRKIKDYHKYGPI